MILPITLATTASWKDKNGDADGGAVAFQHPDDSFTYYRTSIDVHDKTLTLTDPDPGHGDKDWNAHSPETSS